MATDWVGGGGGATGLAQGQQKRGQGWGGGRGVASSMYVSMYIYNEHVHRMCHYKQSIFFSSMYIVFMYNGMAVFWIFLA